MKQSKFSNHKSPFSVAAALWLIAAVLLSAHAAPPLKVLLLDGQNNHNWRATTPALRAALEQSGRFTVTVATTPPTSADAAAWAKFHPHFRDYAAVVSNFNDFGAHPAPHAFLDTLTNYVAAGGGFVSVHAAGSGFPHYPAMARMVGLAWGLTADFGSALELDQQGHWHRTPAGQGLPTGHGHLFVWTVTAREPSHPILAGLPLTWKHGPDELWYRARGPARQLEVLATAFAPQTQLNEPVLWTVRYGKGRVFVTLMGHNVTGIRSPDFATLLDRGCEWAATGKVTLPAPKHF